MPADQADPPAKGKRRPPHLRPVSDLPAEPDDPRPLIRLRKGQGHEHVLATLDTLRTDPDLYERDHALVHVVGAPEPLEGDRAPIAAGTPLIRPMAQATLWERSSAIARFEKYDERAGGFVATDPPPAVLAAILARGDYPGTRRLVGVSESPMLRPDGGLTFGRGYDAVTGFLCLPTIDFLPPPASPTQAEGAAALAELREVFADFPHRDESSRMVPVAAILTVFARPAILGAVPGFLLDASTRGSGKTLQADAISALATGRIPPPMSYPHDDEELEKVLGAYALKGPQIIKLDNVTRTFGGGPIDRVLTATDTVEMRVLGQSTIPELSWRAIILATGNNMALTGDTSRRVLIGRVESPLENPEDRAEGDFLHPDLLGWIREHRARLVRAALTALRAWVVAGRPRMGCKPWGSFGPWSALVPPAIVYCGGADPMLSRPAATGEEEPEKAAMMSILAGLARLDSTGQGVTVKSMLELLYSRERMRGEAPPDGFDDLRDALESLAPPRPGQAPDATKLGNRMRTLGKGRVIGGRKLAPAETKAHGGAVRWRVVQA